MEFLRLSQRCKGEMNGRMLDRMEAQQYLPCLLLVLLPKFHYYIISTLGSKYMTLVMCPIRNTAGFNSFTKSFVLQGLGLLDQFPTGWFSVLQHGGWSDRLGWGPSKSQMS